MTETPPPSQPDSSHRNAPPGCLFSVFATIVLVPAAAVVLHRIWPTSQALKVLACTLVTVPWAACVTTVLRFALSEKAMTIVNGWMIWLPLITACLVPRYGWGAPIYVGAGFVIWALAGLTFQRAR